MSPSHNAAMLLLHIEIVNFLKPIFFFSTEKDYCCELKRKLKGLRPKATTYELKLH